MASNNSEEWVTKLQESLTDLKISSVNVESKLDQLQQGLQKLEIAMDAMKDVTSTQETRIQLLESHCARIPRALNEDFALMKAQLRNYNRVIWIIATTVAALVAQNVFKMVM